jgi:hypothetical protein
MPYLGKQPAASALVVESGSIQSAEIEDGTIEDSDISSDFKALLSGSAVVNASSVTAASISGSITSTGSFGKVEVGDGKITTAGNMVLDADGAQIRLEDGGTEFGRLSRVSSDLVIKSMTNDKDILLKGVDNSSTITALSLDMSEGGNAEFSGNVSGSLVSTASFGSVNATHLNGVFEGTLGSVANALISGSTVVNAPNISGSITSTGSFGSLVVADKVQGNLDFGGNITAAGDISTSGSIFAREFHTEFTSASVIFASGSNKFGDDSGDTHRFTGSMDVSGSLDIPHGNLSVIDSVGIGTNNPTVAFEVFGSSDQQIRIDSTGNRAQLQFDGKKTSDAEFAEINFANDGDSAAAIHAMRDGANDAARLVFFTQATGGSVTERMSVDSTGNVGIGSSSPTLKLDVNGGAVINGNTIVGRGGEQKGRLTIQSRTGTASRKTNAIVAVPYNDASESICMIGMDGQSSQNEMHIGSNTSDFMSPTFIDFFTAADVNSQTNSRVMRMTSAQKVGIGTDNPTGVLQIQDTTTGTVGETLTLDTNQTLGGRGTMIRFTGNNRGFVGAEIQGRIDGDGSEAMSLLFVTNDGSGTNEIMRITADEKVGIGTIAPLTALHVHGAAGNPVSSSTTPTAIARFGTAGLNSVLDIGQGDNPYPMFLQSADRSNLGQFYELSLNPVGGNVGIGTLNPTNVLHIDNGTSSSGCNLLVQNNGSTGWVGAGLILNVQNAHQRGAGVFMHNENAAEGFYAGVIYNVNFDRYSICYEARATQDQSTAATDHEIVQIQNDGDYLSTTGTDIQQISDRRLKENIQDFTGGLDVLKNLQPRTFEWKEGRGNNRFGRTGTQYGFIAQEIESGSGVVDNMNLYKKIDIADGELDSDILDGTKYQSQLNAKDALYISAIKELSEKIESQQKQIEELKEGQNG